MAVHQPHLHLLDFSSPPNAMPMDAPPPAFDGADGLLALHADDGTHMPAGSGGVLQGAGGDTAPPPPWPQAAVSLSLFSYSTATRASSLQVGHHQQQLFTAASVASPPNHQLGQVPAASLQPFQIRGSKYLGPVRELLSEFCSLEGNFHAMGDKQGASKAGRWDDDVEAMSSGLWGTPSLSSMDLMELERRKARLLSMVQEVDRRYRRYREQMRSVEVSFEAVAGPGAAQVYTRLARRAMSRHFRCLRDALTAQVRALRKAMGADRDKGSAPAPGATKGDTPRLRVLDQCLRQPARAVDSYPWRPQRGLPERAVAILRAWLFEHFLHPYPNAVDKHILARQTGLSRSQVSNWFINARVRLWKPMIEDMYKEEVNGQQNPSSAAIVKAERSTTAFPGGESYHQQQHFGTAVANHPANTSVISQSPSMVTDGDHNNLFHSYPSLTAAPHGSHNQHSAVVSLTLGLQQQPLAAASSMMQMQQQQRSAGLNFWEGQEGQQSVQLPYRNLMGSSSQLLHDFDLAGTDSCL